MSALSASNVASYAVVSAGSVPAILLTVTVTVDGKRFTANVVDGKAEVNFVVQNRMGKIIPLEITTKSNSKAKSLSVFMKKFTVPQAYRITENNFSTRKDVRYIPIYAVFCLNENKI